MELHEVKSLRSFAAKIRIAALDAIHSIGTGHLGGAMSICEVLSVLYGREMKYKVEDPKWPQRDKLVCSKGHAGPAVYGTLALKGFFPYEELKTLNASDTRLPSHCDKNKTPGVDMTTGSLGQGTSLACGMALADKLQGHDSRTFLIVGDGETNEGQVWEAFTFAAAHKLSNLVVMIDWNKRQLDGFCEDIYPAANFHEKMAAFGFNTVTINGNDIEAVAQALEATRAGGEKPWAIVLDTVKGAGIEDVVNTAANHSMSVGDAAYEKWTAELRQLVAELEG
jgi:transketolase